MWISAYRAWAGGLGSLGHSALDDQQRPGCFNQLFLGAVTRGEDRSPWAFVLLAAVVSRKATTTAMVEVRSGEHRGAPASVIPRYLAICICLIRAQVGSYRDFRHYLF